MARRRAHHTPRTTLIRAWNPSGSSTVFWVENAGGRGLYLQMVQQGDRLFAPAIPGMQLGLGIYNVGSNRIACPVYIEGVNIADGGPSDPNACRSNQMRQVDPYSRAVVSSTFTPGAATGRPLTIVEHGQGYGFGEATFDRPDLHGLVHIYQRNSNRDGQLNYPQYSGYAPTGGAYRDRDGDLRTPSTMGTRSKGAVRGPQVGVGAGNETYQTEHLARTSTSYATDASLVVALQLRSPAELERMLRSAGVTPPSSWYWQPNDPSWYTRVRTTTAQQVPVAPMTPHLGPQGNTGGSAYGSL